jgi:histone RNA hairpin-binding protein
MTTSFPIDLLSLSLEENLHHHPRRRKMEPRKEETDPRRLSQRQKQINYGKCTVGYQEYLQRVPVLERAPTDPHTPRIELGHSKKTWDRIAKAWRRRLHDYDPPKVT